MDEVPSPSNIPVAPAIPPTPAVSPRRSRKGVVIGLILAILIVLLIGCLYWFYNQFSNTITPSVSPSPETLTGPQLPPLNFSGSLNPDDPGTANRQALLQNTSLLADVSSALSPEQIATLLKERLGLKTDDSDSDVLSDVAEVVIYGTNPLYPDTDVDGEMDGAEAVKNTNPLRPDDTWVGNEQELINYRLAYWKTNFALSDQAKQFSTRDMRRIADVGQISVLLDLYYKEQSTYPVASSWTAAWQEIVAKNTGTLFKGTGDLMASTLVLDPLNQTPFVYTYTSSSDGSQYTFTYGLEAEKVQRTQSGEKGVISPVTSKALSYIPAASLLGWSEIKHIIPVAQALEQFVGSRFSKDGFRNDIYGDENGTWRKLIPKYTQEEMKYHFVLAARHAGIPGYCDRNSCYCANGTTILFGKNESVCKSINAPKTIVAGQSFPATITMRNSGEKLWRSDKTPHLLGATDPEDTLRWGIGRIPLPKGNVGINEDVTFAFNAVAPEKAGKYDFSWKMVEETEEWFGQKCNISITVTPAVCSDTLDNDGDTVSDSADPGCHSDGNANNPASYVPTDPDEANTVITTVPSNQPTDLPPGTVTQCNDNLDNDGDAVSDSADPGCHTDGNPNNPSTYVPTDPDESNTSTGGPTNTPKFPVFESTPTPSPTFNPGQFREGD